MRHTILMITLLLVAALAVGCTPTDEKSAVGPGESKTAAQFDKAKTETKEAAQAMQDYTYTQKAEFVAKMKKELAEIQEELDRLSAKVDRSSGVVKAEAETQLEAVREKWAQAKQQLDRAGSATESTWDSVKGGFETIYGELKDSFEKTRQWLSDKIEP
jgi:molecular chaperone GrpE (heat shock protein)